MAPPIVHLDYIACLPIRTEPIIPLSGLGALSTNVLGSLNSGLGSSAEVGSSNLDNATAIGANSRVDCSNCMVLGSINGIGMWNQQCKCWNWYYQPRRSINIWKYNGEKSNAI